MVKELTQEEKDFVALVIADLETPYEVFMEMLVEDYQNGRIN